MPKNKPATQDAQVQPQPNTLHDMAMTSRAVLSEYRSTLFSQNQSTEGEISPDIQDAKWGIYN